MKLKTTNFANTLIVTLILLEVTKDTYTLDVFKFILQWTALLVPGRPDPLPESADHDAFPLVVARMYDPPRLELCEPQLWCCRLPHSQTVLHHRSAVFELH